MTKKKGKYEGKGNSSFGTISVIAIWLVGLIGIILLGRLGVFASAWFRHLLKALFSGICLLSAWMPRNKKHIAEKILLTLGACTVWVATAGVPVRFVLLIELLVVYAAIVCLLILKFQNRKRSETFFLMTLCFAFSVLLWSTRYTFADEVSDMRYWPVFLALGIVAAAISAWLLYHRKVKLKYDNKANKVLTCIVAGFVTFTLVWQTRTNLNYILDTSEPVKYQLEVVEKYTRRGGYRSRTKLYLIADNNGCELKFEATVAQYHHYEVGDKIPVILRQGAFGDAYYMIE